MKEDKLLKIVVMIGLLMVCLVSPLGAENASVIVTADQLYNSAVDTYKTVIEHYHFSINVLLVMLGISLTIFTILKFSDSKKLDDAKQKINEAKQQVEDAKQQVDSFIERYEREANGRLQELHQGQQELRQGLQESELYLKFQIALSQNTPEEKKTQLRELLQEAEEKGANPLLKAGVRFNIAYVTENLEERVEAYSTTINFIEQALTPTTDEATRRELEDILAKSYNNKGVALRKQNKSAEALPCFDKAIELKPTHAEAYYNKGVALKKLGDEAENPQAKKEYYQQALNVVNEGLQKRLTIGQETKEHEEILKAQLEEKLAKLQA